MIDWKKARPLLLGGAGIYLVYTAFSLFKERSEAGSVMPLWLNILFSALFVLAAVAIFVYAVVLWRRADKSEKELEAEIAKEEEEKNRELSQNAQPVQTPEEGTQKEDTQPEEG